MKAVGIVQVVVLLRRKEKTFPFCWRISTRRRKVVMVH